MSRPRRAPSSFCSLHQIRRDAGTDAVTLHVHEIDDDDLVLYQVVVEPHLLTGVSCQEDIREMTFSYTLSRRGIPDGLLLRSNPRRNHTRKRQRSE